MGNVISRVDNSKDGGRAAVIPRRGTALVLTDGAPLQQGPFTLSRAGLTACGTPSIEEWEQCGDVLQQIEGAVQWWVGDWLNFGKNAYGEKYSQARDTTHLTYQTLANIAYVAQHIEISRRRENVTFSLHAELAALPPADQEVWFDRIEDEGLSRSELRPALRLQRRREQVCRQRPPRGALPRHICRPALGV